VRQSDEGQVWPADKNAAKDATPAEPRKEESATEDVLAPGDAPASAAGPAVTETRSEPAPDTSVVDGLFARMVRDMQLPRFPGGNSLSPPQTATPGPASSLERSATPAPDAAGGTARRSLSALEEDLAPAQEQTNPGGVELDLLRVLFGRFSVRISVLVVGSLVFCGLRQRAAEEPRDLAKVRLAKRSASEPPHQR
jgi:hypothetical protein